MPIRPQDVQTWPTLDRQQLAEVLSYAVRHQFRDATFWSAVQAEMARHPVMAAQLRGLLNALHAQTRHTPDETFWLFRIEAVRPYLAAQPVPPATPSTFADPPSGGGRALRGARHAVDGTRKSGVAAVEFRSADSAVAGGQSVRR